MALPSSPPLLPELDPPTSPPLLPEEPPDLPIRPNDLPVGSSRKRPLSDYGSLSSDPLFSEATSEAEEDGEDRRRRKRLVKGPWYNLRRVSAQSLRRSMARKERLRAPDSGVFMGSDLSDDSIDSTLSSRRRLSRMEVYDRSPQSSPPRTKPRPPTAEDLAANAINYCLDTGHESVDLSDLGMTELGNETLKPLHQLIRQAHSDLTHPPSEDEFSPLTPSIRLFLFGNKLTSLPSELFRLTNITVLSLRNNELDEIPPIIGRLLNLHELNIAQNSIKWLPWEMLDLMHCRGTHKQITVRPNPLVNPMLDLTGPSPLPRPTYAPGEFKEHLSRWGETSGAFFQQMKQWYSEDDIQWTIRHELELRLKLSRLRLNNYLHEVSGAGHEVKICKEQMVYIASSAVRFFDVDGTLCRTTTSSAITNDDDRFAAVADALVDKPVTAADSSVPSLFELAVRSVRANFIPSDFRDLADELPSGVSAALQKAFRDADYGDECCSVCSKRFIVARAEWMEYWFNGFPSQDCLTQETVLPFLRRVCSWKCAQPSDLGSFRS